MASRPDSEDIMRMKAILAQNPRSLLFAQLADAYRREGRLEEAIHICQEGLTHHLNYASAYMVLGRSYKEQGALLAAQDAFQRVLDLDPESVLAHHFLGEIAESQGEISEALKAYKAAFTLHPFDKQVRAAVERLQALTTAETLPSKGAKAPPALSVEPGLLAAATMPPAPHEIHRPAPPDDKQPLATETLADLYAAQGLYDQAADIYARVMAGAPDRKDLVQKHQDILTRAREALESEASTSGKGSGALSLLEAWRDAFRTLKDDREPSTRLLEAWRDAFRKLKDQRDETASNAFRKVETVREESVVLLEAWRDAFRRLKSARGGIG